MSSLIVKMLAERPPAELSAMRSKLDAEKAKLEAEMARLDLELEQVMEATAVKARSVKGATRASRRRSGPSTFQRVKDFVAAHDGEFSPADASNALKAEGWTGSPSGVYNAFRRMAEDNFIVKVDEGVYRLASDVDSSELASSNGSHQESLSEAPT